MKKTFKFYSLLLGALTLIISCSKTDVTPAVVTLPATVFCKLNKMVNNQGTYEFTYDTKGNISSYTLTTLDGNNTQQLRYNCNYDANNKLQSATQSFSINGKIQAGGGFFVYIFTADLLTSINYFSSSSSTKPFANSVLKYDANKRLVENVYQNGAYTNTDKYGYDTNGNFTRHSSLDSVGYVDDLVNTYDISKNTEQILAKLLPFDLATGQPWKVNIVITTKDTYTEPQAKPIITTGNRTNLKTDAKGWVISSTYTLSDGTVTNETNTLSDCN